MMLLILVRIFDMKKFLFLLVIIAGSASAQELDTLTVDTVEVLPKNKTGVFFFVGSEFGPSPSGLISQGSIGAGIKYNKVEVGYKATVYESDGLRRRLIFPNQFDLIYGQAGVYAGYALVDKKWYHLSAIGSWQIGDMIWEQADNKNDLFRETINTWQVGLKVESPIIRYLRPVLVVGFQTMSNFSLPGVSKEDFTGIFLALNVKLGYFNQ